MSLKKVGQYLAKTAQGPVMYSGKQTGIIAPAKQVPVIQATKAAPTPDAPESLIKKLKDLFLAPWRKSLHDPSEFD